MHPGDQRLISMDLRELLAEHAQELSARAESNESFHVIPFSTADDVVRRRDSSRFAISRRHDIGGNEVRELYVIWANFDSCTGEVEGERILVYYAALGFDTEELQRRLASFAKANFNTSIISEKELHRR